MSTERCNLADAVKRCYLFACSIENTIHRSASDPIKLTFSLLHYDLDKISMALLSVPLDRSWMLSITCTSRA
eukprot:78772-Pleurochrysis_carterae.AAC.1